MEASSIERAVESLLVASPRPVAVREIMDAYPDSDVDGAITALKAFWATRGMRIEEGREGLRMVPAPSVSERLAEADGKRGRQLSEAAVATLAVIAMHQPVTLQDIERLRGVRMSRGIMDSLLDAGFVRVAMRRTDAGRAAAYVTTETFLEHYSLGALSDLPTPEEIIDLVNPPSD